MTDHNERTQNWWLHGDDESSINKRAFLLHHGSADHVKKILSVHPSHIGLSLGNPHTPPEVFEAGFEKHPHMRIAIAVHPRCPASVHAKALVFDHPLVRSAALRNPTHTTKAQAQAALNDKDIDVVHTAMDRLNRHAIAQDQGESDRNRLLKESKKSYINFSREIGIVESSENSTKIDAKCASDVPNLGMNVPDLGMNAAEFAALFEQILTEAASRKDHFLAKHGTPDTIDTILDRGPMRGNLHALGHALKNPAFTRAHHERLMAHQSDDVRIHAAYSPHATRADLHKLIQDPSQYIRWAASDALDSMKPEQQTLGHNMLKEAVLLDEARRSDNFFARAGTADHIILESKEDFFAKHGSADHLTHILTKSHAGADGETSFWKASKNPNLTRAHHEILMNHEDPMARYWATTNPHTTNADLEHLAYDHDNNVRSGVQHAQRLRDIFPDAYDKDGRVLPKHEDWVRGEKPLSLNEGALAESKMGFFARYGTQRDIEDSIENGDEHEHANVSDNPAFTRAHHEMLMNHPDASARVQALYSPHLTRADLDKLLKDPNSHVRAIAGVRQERVQLKPLAESKKTYRDISIQAGIRSYEPQEETVVDPLFSHYELDGDEGKKRIYVPVSNIIADAKETNEGLRDMAAAKVVKEDQDQGHEWQSWELANHLQISGGVHHAYAEAGVNHYPYAQGDGGDVSMHRISAIHNHNFSSKGTNDFLHRNYHGLQRPWDGGHRQRVALLDSVFHEHTREPLNVVSGLRQSPQEIIDHARSLGHEVGEHIHLHLPAYTSTTTRVGTALAFTKAYPGTPSSTGKGVYVINGVPHADSNVHMLHIHIPVGHKAVGLETHPDLENAHEEELILPRDTILRVNTTPSVYRMGHRNVNVWMSHVVGSNSVPLKPLPHVHKETNIS